MFLDHGLEGDYLLSAGVVAVSLVGLALSLVASELDLAGVGDDDKVAAIDVWGVGRLMLS